MGPTTLSVVFTDLVGSTALRRDLGDEVADDLRREHDELLGQLVGRHDGTVVKTLGDGIMAVFPTASAAVAFSVAAQRAIARRGRWTARSPGMRLGISAGEVVAEGGDVFGTPVVEAARLCDRASGGEILASELVQALAGPRSEVAFEPAGQLELKGLPAPVPAASVLWSAGDERARIPLPSRVDAPDPVPFIGRPSEARVLAEAWERASRGQRQTVLVAGEPGIGKTRLVFEFVRAAYENGAVVLYGRCDEGVAFAFQPFVEALRHYATYADDGDLPDALGPYPGELTRLVPELASRLPPQAPQRPADPQVETLRMFDAVVGWLAAASRADPIVLVLDDLHWSAKPTLLLARHLLQWDEPMRVMVVGAYRDTELQRGHPVADFLADLRRLAPGVVRIQLGGLEGPDVDAIVEAAVGRTLDDGAGRLAKRIHAESGGNPFFAVEIVRHLLASDAISAERVFTAEPSALGIPESLREVISARVNRLTPTGIGVLTLASVVGSEFDVGVLEASRDLDEEALLSGLEEAVAAHLLEEVPTPRPRLRFSHDLVRAVLYGGLTSLRRAQLHQRVGRSIERVLGSHGERVPELAHHYSQAAAVGDVAKAVEYAGLAGDYARDRLAHDEASSWYRRALELLEPSPDADLDLRYHLLAELGEAERRAGIISSRETLLAAARVAEQRADAEGLARAALANNRGFFSQLGGVDVERIEVLERALDACSPAESGTRARLLATLASELMWADDADRRFAISDEALATADRLGDPATRAHVLALRYIAISAPETLPERRANMDALVDLGDELDDPVLRFHGAYFRAAAAVEAGDIAQVERDTAVAEHAAVELRQPALSWHITMGRASLAYLHADLPEAERLAAEAWEFGARGGQAEAIQFYGGQLLYLRRVQGRLGEVIEASRRALAVDPALTRAPIDAHVITRCLYDGGYVGEARERYERAAASGFAAGRRDLITGATLTNLAYLAARLRDAPRAAELYELLAPYPDRFFSMLMFQPCTAHYLGMLAAAMGRSDEAEQRFAVAAAHHERVRAPLFLAETRIEWARAVADAGRRAQARTLAEQALAAGVEHRAYGVECEARALLGEQHPG